MWREIDGKDQTAVLTRQSEESNGEGFIHWNGENMYEVKWRKLQVSAGTAQIHLRHALPRAFSFPINLIVDPKERERCEPYDPRYLHSWTFATSPRS
jgi:hypothetical protein